MDASFELPVIYKDKELLFPTQLIQYGYTHKFQVQVNGLEVLFEPDEERAYRAIVDPKEAERSKIDAELLKSIAEAIEAVTK